MSTTTKTKRLTKEQKRVKKIVAYLKDFIQTYDNQVGYLNYSDKNIINDILYGLGVALNEKEYEYYDGFQKFKELLKKHLEKDTCYVRVGTVENVCEINSENINDRKKK